MSRRGGNPYKKADHWTRKAKAQGYEARSVFKLEEVERRFRVIPRGGRILDLGCAPGSWSRYAAEAAGRGATLVGIDLQPVPAYPGTFLQESVYDVPPERFRELLGGPADLVLSDMAPNTTGNRLADHVAQLELATAAFNLARALLKPGGTFVVKVFDGEDAHAFVLEVNKVFEKTKRVRPKATRDISVEFFLVALGYNGGQEAT